MSSGSVFTRSKGDSSGSNEDGDEEEEKGTEIITVAECEKESKRNKRRVFGRYGVRIRNGKKALLFRFRKFQKLFKLSLSSASPSDSPPNSASRKSFSGKSRFGGGLCCCACFSKPHVIEDDDSQGNNVVPDDPEEFSYEHLKSMIEKNDFYAKECDTHFDD